VFQSYYEQTLLQDYSPSAISWIASVQQCLIYSAGIVLGKIFDGYGPRWLLIIGGLTKVFGLMMTSVSTK
jgi:MFS family permease